MITLVMDKVGLSARQSWSYGNLLIYDRVYNSDKYLILSMLFRGLFHTWPHKTSLTVL